MSTFTSHMLKMEMERVWNTKPCLCPLHLISWNREGYGWCFSNWLFWTRGTPMRLNPKRRRLWR